ncbi:MAG: hypothetical protein ABIR56_07205 [Polaromonas sp.]
MSGENSELKNIFSAQGANMATSSILGGSPSPEEISGKDIHALGPSDNSDSGSDAIGAYSEDELASDSDASGTGERASVESDLEQTDADILPDHIEQATGADADNGLDDTAGEDSEDSEELSDVEELVDDSDDLELDEGEDASGKA